jgi:serine/threonine protein kinase
VGALKVLHPSKNPDTYTKQIKRMRNEIDALAAIRHPNIIRILDSNLDERWFVMEYFPEGPLSKHLTRYQGNILVALEAFRPLVEGVAEMHSKGQVHRDIKPENVFLSGTGNLLLGDLGLVFFMDDERSRVTETFENVGSRDWMPAWAMSMRVEEVRPSFDVFSLGKLLWSMLSGQPRLQLWYHHEEKFELERMFPDMPEMRWARKILDVCVVEKEERCLADAGYLLQTIDSLLPAIRRHCQVVEEGVERACRVCGLGRYHYVVNENTTAAQKFGIQPTGTNKYKIFSCNYCGHVEWFYLPGRKPRAWE